MREFIAFDSHKVYTLAEREDRESGQCRQTRITHERGAIREFLSGSEPGTAVAVEATGNWYWIVDEIEAAGLVPKLVVPPKNVVPPVLQRLTQTLMGCHWSGTVAYHE